MSFGATQNQTHAMHNHPLPPEGLPHKHPSPYLWLGERVMCVPLLKRTPMLRLES